MRIDFIKIKQEIELLQKQKLAMKTEPDKSEYDWQNGDNYKLRKGAFQSERGKVFIVKPIGTYEQIDRIFNVYIVYMQSGYLKETILRNLIECEYPILRLEMMFQEGPDSEKFLKKVFDLPLAAIRRQDIELIEQLYDYIQFKDFPQYPELMLTELFVQSKNSKNRYNLEHCIAILNLFINKGLKCKNADEIIEDLKNNKFFEKSDKIFELIRQLRWIL